MTDIETAATKLSATSLKLIGQILLKHDAGVIEACQEAVQAAMLEGAIKMQKACAKVAKEHLNIGIAMYNEDDILALDPREVIK